MFSSKNDTFGLTLRFPTGLGKVHLNRNGIFFKIPKDNGIVPFHWNHICVSINKDTHQVVVNGHQWPNGNHTIRVSDNATLSQLLMGSKIQSSINYGGFNFKGELTELNIWSEIVSLNDMMEISQTCGNPKPVPNVLNWSDDVIESNLTGNHYPKIKDINQLCSDPTAKISHFQLIPHLADQDGAMKTCRIMGGILASPKNLKEYRSWKSKKCRFSIRTQVQTIELNLSYFSCNLGLKCLGLKSPDLYLIMLQHSALREF